MQQLAIVERDCVGIGIAQLQRARSDDVETPAATSVGELAMTRRISRRRRLLLERLGQLAVPSLEFLEQSHVLDGDHGLVGEGLEQGDLPVREESTVLRS